MPYLPAGPHCGVQVMTPVLELKLAPEGSAGATDHVTGPAAHAPSVGTGVGVVSVLVSTTVCGDGMFDTLTVPAWCVTWIVNGLLDPASPLAAVAVSVNGP